jgi:4-hydroxybenzoate polyprenyltransferase
VTGSPLIKIEKYTQLLRFHHWIKNILVFVPIFFNMHLFDQPVLLNTVMGFVCFCLLSSIIYILNDLRDIEKDRRHSTKCRRPLAAGTQVDFPPTGIQKDKREIQSLVLLFPLLSVLF